MARIAGNKFAGIASGNSEKEALKQSRAIAEGKPYLNLQLAESLHKMVSYAIGLIREINLIEQKTATMPGSTKEIARSYKSYAAGYYLMKLESLYKRLENKAIEIASLLIKNSENKGWRALKAHAERIMDHAIALKGNRSKTAGSLSKDGFFDRDKKSSSKSAVKPLLEQLSKDLLSLETTLKKAIAAAMANSGNRKMANMASSFSALSETRGNRNRLNLGLPKKLPAELSSELSADIKELEKTFNSRCFRAAVILCGRILELALHRKYYEATGNDILEKNPGIGLGKLIAKMSEKNIYFPPGLTQQIHLINQVRIHSVHKKQQAFYPSEKQALAIVLYTVDCIEALFG